MANGENGHENRLVRPSIRIRKEENNGAKDYYRLGIRRTKVDY